MPPRKMKALGAVNYENTRRSKRISSLEGTVKYCTDRPSPKKASHNSVTEVKLLNRELKMTISHEVTKKTLNENQQKHSQVRPTKKKTLSYSEAEMGCQLKLENCNQLDKKSDTKKSKSSAIKNTSLKRPNFDDDNVMNKKYRKIENITVSSQVMSPSQNRERKVKIKQIKKKCSNNKRPSSSNISESSWTKNISSATRTITASTNDFVSIDKKLPIVKVTDINRNDFTLVKEDSLPKIAKNYMSEDLTDHMDSSIDTSQSTTTLDIFERNIENRDSLLTKLAANLERIDLEPIKWSSSRNSNEKVRLDCLKGKLFESKVLCGEKKLYQACKDIQTFYEKFEKAYNSMTSINNEVRDEAKSDAAVTCQNTHTESDGDDTNPTATDYVGNNNKKSIFTPNSNVENCINNIKFHEPKACTNQFQNRNKTQQNNKIFKGDETLTPNTQDTLDHVRNQYVEENDDDDTISLFAESITGLDISKRSNRLSDFQQAQDCPPDFVTTDRSASKSPVQHIPTLETNQPSWTNGSLSETKTLNKHKSIAELDNRIDEYIPDFVSKNPSSLSKHITYKPTTIVNQNESQAGTSAHSFVENMCQKQNADSTSYNKDHDVEVNINERRSNFKDQVGTFKEKNSFYETNSTDYMTARPLMGDCFPSMHCIQSFVFKGVCFFNLINKCVKRSCRFPHIIIHVDEVKRRLITLGNELLIQEYILIRKNSTLLNMYVSCFVEVCIERRLTRVLVEIILNVVVMMNKSNVNHNVKSSVEHLKTIENALLYLNTESIDDCADLLQYGVDANTLLCEFLLKIIAETQNFTRFIKVFKTITKYMTCHNMQFNVHVAIQLMERVCILPYDDQLSRALIDIIKRTDDAILTVSLIGEFEKLLYCSNRGLYDAFVFHRKRKLLNQTVSRESYSSPFATPGADASNGSYVSATQTVTPASYSPDTTNLDNLFKEPIFHRTIGLKPMNVLNNEVGKSMSPYSISKSENTRKHSGPADFSQRSSTLNRNFKMPHGRIPQVPKQTLH